MSGLRYTPATLIAKGITRGLARGTARGCVVAIALMAMGATTGAALTSIRRSASTFPAEQNPISLSLVKTASLGSSADPSSDSEKASAVLEGKQNDLRNDRQNDRQTYQQAIALANQAVAAYQAAGKAQKSSRSLVFTRKERDLWQATLQKLADIPESSALHAQAATKYVHYQQLLTTAAGKLAKADGAFLSEIIEEAGVAVQSVHITVCQIGPAPKVADRGNTARAQVQSEQAQSEQCRHHQGDQPMASAASLIKMPIAMVLMNKVTTESIDLDDEIFIDPDNFTENAEGAKIDVGQSYPLGKVMAHMIKESNNIATNQLIDYLGWDYFASTLTEKGYVDTSVGHKLSGNSIMPKNAGTQINQSTTNDITAMMASIYRLQSPGDEKLLDALVRQHDREIGYQALQNMGPAVHWMGEKTGQNDRVIGSSLGVKIGEDLYALTVAIDHSGDLHAMRDIIRGVADHVLETGPLMGRLEPSVAMN